MEDDGKKICFGFSKLKKKVTIVSNNKPVKSDSDVQFIDCLEGKSIKVKNEEPKKSVLIIPLNKPDSNNVVQSRLLEKQNKVKVLNKSAIVTEITSESHTKDGVPAKVSVENLDDIAAREIIEDLKKAKENKEESQVFTVPMSSIPVGEKESSLEDYESIPVSQFGVAMLRGMGWTPGKGIGKNEKVVDAKLPVLRPKGLGLGADKVIEPKKPAANEEVLKLVKGSSVRIIAGSHKDLFGEVIGFDEETGRSIVKMALGGSVLTFNEFMVQPVNKEVYNKNCRVINVKKYEDYKKKEDTGSKEVENRSEKSKIESRKTRKHSSSNSDDNSSPARKISEPKHEIKMKVAEKQRKNYYSSDDQKNNYRKMKEQTKSKSSKVDKHSNRDLKKKYRSRSSSSESSESSSRERPKSSHRRRKYSESDDSETDDRKYRSTEVRVKHKDNYKKRSKSPPIRDKEETRYSSKSHKSHKSVIDSKHEKEKSKSKKHSKRYSSCSSSSEERYARRDKKDKSSKKKRSRSRSPRR